MSVTGGPASVLTTDTINLSFSGFPAGISGDLSNGDLPNTVQPTTCCSYIIGGPGGGNTATSLLTASATAPVGVYTITLLGIAYQCDGSACNTYTATGAQTTATFTLTVTAAPAPPATPDFSLKFQSPAINIEASGIYAVPQQDILTLTPLNGFDDSVNVVYSTLPAGLSVIPGGSNVESVNPSANSLSWTDPAGSPLQLSISADPGTAVDGAYPITFTVTDTTTPTLSHTATLNVTILDAAPTNPGPPNFAITVISQQPVTIYQQNGTTIQGIPLVIQAQPTGSQPVGGDPMLPIALTITLPSGVNFYSGQPAPFGTIANCVADLNGGSLITPSGPGEVCTISSMTNTGTTIPLDINGPAITIWFAANAPNSTAGTYQAIITGTTPEFNAPMTTTFTLVIAPLGP